MAIAQVVFGYFVRKKSSVEPAQPHRADSTAAQVTVVFAREVPAASKVRHAGSTLHRPPVTRPLDLRWSNNLSLR